MRTFVQVKNYGIKAICFALVGRITNDRGHIFNHNLDPRVKVVIEDVAAVIRDAANQGKANRFDAIILDLYEGPHAPDRRRGAYLYGARALKLSHCALTSGGVFAVWSEDPDKGFEKRLKAAGFSVDRQRPGRGGRRHVVYISRKRSGPGIRSSG